MDIDMISTSSISIYFENWCPVIIPFSERKGYMAKNSL